MTTLYGIAEQVANRVGNGSVQIYIKDVVDAYAFLVKAQWYENQKSDVKEVDGQFIVTFKDLQPTFDETVAQYYVENPSSYVSLPAESGIVFVGFAKGQDKGFVRLSAGTWGRNTLASVFGGRQTYYEESNKTYFPKMKEATKGDIMMKLAIALDNIDVDEPLSIPRNIVGNIVDTVVSKYAKANV